jgi:hypothetical protein
VGGYGKANMPYKNEAKWNTIFNQYLREKKMYGFFELKVTVTETFPFSKIESVQYDGLQATEKGGLIWKLSDMDMRPKPCDVLSIPPQPSYIVIHFIDGFYFIRIKDIVEMREEGKISITHEMARNKAEKILLTATATP